MELKSQLNFIETLLTLTENSCSNVTKASKGEENYFLEGFLDPPQLHALINALHVSLPFVKFEILDNECRHRGAFEAASNEFTTVVCPRLWALCAEEFQIESYNKTTFFPYSPRQWLKQILDALTGKDDSQKLCVTRRSAGLPHLIASLLENAPINELNDEQGLFHQTMRQLLACSERQNSELE
uniref:DUF2428 domain-containing protein n=1 Tax=Meloidogyne javanica TaxID=6303 RepID=A0A915MDI4_MELJA